MWVPKAVVGWFQISKEGFDDLRIDRAQLQAQRDLYKEEVVRLHIVEDWLRMQVNSLQAERTALLEKAYGIRVPTPEIVRAPVMNDLTAERDFSFDDIGDHAAKLIGYPTYDKQ